jgi:hypothetical protein
MTVFVKKDNGKQEAIDGSHDDLVMATAIAHFIAKQQSYTWIEIKPDEPKFIMENFNLEEQQDNGEFMSWEDY